MLGALKAAGEAPGLLQEYLPSANLSFLLGSGASQPAISLAGNVEAQLNKLLEKDEQPAADLLALEFIEQLEEENQNAAKGAQSELGKQTLEAYKDFLERLDRVLFERKSTLLPRQSTIFTTNYDTFIEEAASKISNLILNDGFDRTSPLANYKFAPEQLFDRHYRSGTVYTRQAELPTINLVKLHGSLNWHKNEGSIVYSTQVVPRLSDEDRKDPMKVRTSLNSRAVVLPYLRKFSSTLLDRTYYDLLRLLSSTLEKENSLLLVFGFSFADEHIRDIVKRGLRNPTSQMMVFAYNHDAATQAHNYFSDQRNVFIIDPMDGQLGFAELNTALSQALGQERTADG